MQARRWQLAVSCEVSLNWAICHHAVCPLVKNTQPLPHLCGMARHLKAALVPPAAADSRSEQRFSKAAHPVLFFGEWQQKDDLKKKKHINASRTDEDPTLVACDRAVRVKLSTIETHAHLGGDSHRCVWMSPMSMSFAGGAASSGKQPIRGLFQAAVTMQLQQLWRSSGPIETITTTTLSTTSVPSPNMQQRQECDSHFREVLSSSISGNNMLYTWKTARTRCDSANEHSVCQSKPLKVTSATLTLNHTPRFQPRF